MVITGKRHDFRIAYRAGFDETGRIAGVDFMQYARCGWAQDLSLPVADRAMLHADNAYCLPACRIESHRLKTNTQSATAFRGFGGPQGMIGIERVIDHIAHDLGMDPVEVRQVNYYDRPPGGSRPRTPRGYFRQEEGQSDALWHGGRGFRTACDDRRASGVLRLCAPAGGDRGLERAARNDPKGDRLCPGEVRDLFHVDPSQPGRGAGACLPGRIGPSEPWRNRDGPGVVPQSGAGRRRPVRP